VNAPLEPPEGVPRSAARMLVLLQSMGAHKYDPKVVVQLLDIMHSWSMVILNDAATNARMRVLPNQPQLACGPEPPIEAKDVELAVKSRVEHGFTRVAAREVLAQQAAEINSEPMPILPKRTLVALPPPEECLPSARRLLATGLDVDDIDAEEHCLLDGLGAENDGAPHAWWHDRVARLSRPRGVEEETFGEPPPPKRQKH